MKYSEKIAASAIDTQGIDLILNLPFFLYLFHTLSDWSMCYAKLFDIWIKFAFVHVCIVLNVIPF